MFILFVQPYMIGVGKRESLRGAGQEIEMRLSEKTRRIVLMLPLHSSYVHRNFRLVYTFYLMQYVLHTYISVCIYLLFVYNLRLHKVS